MCTRNVIISTNYPEQYTEPLLYYLAFSFVNTFFVLFLLSCVLCFFFQFNKIHPIKNIQIHLFTFSSLLSICKGW